MTALLKGRVTIIVRAPFLFPGVEAGAFGFDRVALRNLNGDMILPMDQVRGLIRHGLADLERTDLIQALFGAGSDDATKNPDGSFLPVRSAMFIGDLVAGPIARPASAPAHRVKIHEDSGAAEEGYLLTLEQVASPGCEVAFSGGIALFSNEDPSAIAAALEIALKVHGSVGALKGVGFGEIIGCTVTLAAASAAVPRRDPGGNRLRLRFTLDRPYLIDPERVADNAWRGRRDIPGGALKGLLARNAELSGVRLDGNALSHIRIGHARRAGDTARPMPVSVVGAGQGFADLSLDGCFVDRPVPQVDWKSENDRIKAFGFGQNPTVRMDERVHTRIDADTGAAMPELLYTTIALEQDREGFICDIDLTGLDAGQREAILGLLSRPLFGLGMTGAILQPNELQAAPPAETTEAGRVVIMLKTPGLLADPYDDSDGITPASPAQAYGAFWKSLLPASTMTGCFARQRLAGGYHALRFRVLSGEYRPWMLTSPGSVFTIDLARHDVARMNQLLLRGVCRPTLEHTPLNWENCPFLSEAGFGEIGVHHPHFFQS